MDRPNGNTARGWQNKDSEAASFSQYFVVETQIPIHIDKIELLQSLHMQSLLGSVSLPKDLGSSRVNSWISREDLPSNTRTCSDFSLARVPSWTIQTSPGEAASRCMFKCHATTKHCISCYKFRFHLFRIPFWMPFRHTKKNFTKTCVYIYKTSLFARRWHPT